MLNPDRKYSLDTTYPEDYEPGPPNPDASLTWLADWYKTDKGTIKHNYTQIYEKYIKWDIRALLEIGVACGSSLKMWSKYLPAAEITGLDIRPECAGLCKGYHNVRIIIDDAVSWNDGQHYDVIIDDGSHVSNDIVMTWANLWKNVKPGGLYIIEDLRCTHDKAYAEHFTFPKDKDDFSRVHIIRWLDQLMRKTDYRETDIDFIHYYREMLILRKRDANQ